MEGSFFTFALTRLDRKMIISVRLISKAIDCFEQTCRHVKKEAYNLVALERGNIRKTENDMVGSLLVYCTKSNS